MGRQSFRLRRSTSAGTDNVGLGSYPRGGSAFQAQQGVLLVNQDDDKALRSTDFILAYDANEESLFETTAIAHDAIKINWTITDQVIPQPDVESTGIVGLKVVYSYTGYPEAANDGITFWSAEAVNDPSQNLSTQELIHNGLTDNGRWIYYSLFAHYYQDTGGTGTYWYEKLSSVEVLLPVNYESTQKMWERIPLYYREQDTSGELRKFIDIFGFEVDRTRSLIEAVMTGADPSLAEAEGIEQLANLVGLEVNVPDVGVTRTRALLQDIGFLRQRKGTLSGVLGYLRALSGADVDFELVGSDYRATVYAQRANLIGDPRFVYTTSYGVTAQTGSVTTTPIDGGITIATGATGTKVAVISKIAVPVKTGTNYYTSFNWSVTGGTPTIYGGYISNTNTWSTWTSLTVQGELPVSGLDFIDPDNGVNRRVFDMGEAVATGDKYFVLVIDIPANTTITLKRWMVEPNNFGGYFDGDSTFGGFLYQNNFNDYQWSDPSNSNKSYSVFTVQRSRTIKAIRKVMPSILPVNLTFDPYDSDYLRFDWVPGKT
jgi:hypothetical protein